MIEQLLNPVFLVALLQIIAIDILLGGDNAVVIALACRRLSPDKQNKAIVGGVIGAIGLRVVLLVFATQLLELPYLKVIGSVLLLWIGIKLLLPQAEEDDTIDGGTQLISAIKTIIVADAVMSLDNVVAVAGAAKGDLLLIVLGVVISIPIIVWGSRLVLKMMDRFPLVIVLGSALLGWIAGGMIVSDSALSSFLKGAPSWLHYATSVAGAMLVLAIGGLLARQKKAAMT
ncbi:TerC family protein (plasmid) [Pseudomonas luteola]|uniref:TerC family protein n=1 Tax=Pseudomonas luteola TaxID=47886 RepID=UPI003DA0E7F7